VNPPPNQPPELLNGAVVPPEGLPNGIFIFSIIYRDFENSSPSQISVVLDGFSYTMLPADPGARNFTAGVEYVFATTLASGTHTFYFSAADGINTTRHPAVGTIDGPTFQSGGGGGEDGDGVDLTLAIIIALALAVGIPAAMYTVGRTRRQTVRKPPKKSKAKFKALKSPPPAVEPTHTTAQPVIPLQPPQKAPTEQEAPPTPEPVQKPAQKPVMTEDELRAVLSAVRYVSDAEKERLLVKLKTMPYEQQQSILRALPK
jgi:hypothetical protein